QSFKIYTTAPKLGVPLAQPWRILAAWYSQFLGLATFAIFFTCLGPGSWLGSLLGWRLEVPAALLAGVLCLGLVIWAFAVGNPISIVRSEGQYHWLTGGSKLFLDRLPQWRPYE